MTCRASTITQPGALGWIGPVQARAVTSIALRAHRLAIEKVCCPNKRREELQAKTTTYHKKTHFTELKAGKYIPDTLAVL